MRFLIPKGIRNDKTLIETIRRGLMVTANQQKPTCRAKLIIIMIVIPNPEGVRNLIILYISPRF